MDWPAAVPRGLSLVAREAGWHVRKDADGSLICLNEHYEHRPVAVLEMTRVSGSIGNSALKLEQLAQWDQPTPPGLAAERTREQVEECQSSASLTHRLFALRLAFSTEPADRLPYLVNDFLANRLPELRGGTAIIVRVNPQLLYGQMAIARVLVRAGHDPQVLATGLRDPKALEGGAGLVSQDMLGGAMYLQAGLCAASPLHFGFVASRVGGSLVLLFPMSILSPESYQPDTLAELLRPQYLVRPRDALRVAGWALEDEEAFLGWWVASCNRLLAELVNPATHRTKSDVFDANLMLGRILTHHRLMASVQANLAETARYDGIRWGLLFDSLDLFEGLGGGLGSWSDRLTSLSFIEKELTDIREELESYPGVGHIVLPRCERAVSAMLDLATGFRETGAQGWNNKTIENRVRALLRALRNAGHGLRNDDNGAKNIKALMAHRSDLPTDLPDLAWLHLVWLLCFGRWR